MLYQATDTITFKGFGRSKHHTVILLDVDFAADFFGPENRKIVRQPATGPNPAGLEFLDVSKLILPPYY